MPELSPFLTSSPGVGGELEGLNAHRSTELTLAHACLSERLPGPGALPKLASSKHSLALPLRRAGANRSSSS
jgi:hypothetical protein